MNEHRIRRSLRRLLIACSGCCLLAAPAIGSNQPPVGSCVFNTPRGVDADMDQVDDGCDECLEHIVDVPDGRGGLRQVVNPLGCAWSQTCPCVAPRGEEAVWVRRSKYLRCVRRAARNLRTVQRISRDERKFVVRTATDSECGRYHGRPGDRDGDGIPENAFGATCVGDDKVDCNDNCPSRRNRLQKDKDDDGIGNVCDHDRDGDGVVNGVDNCPEKKNETQADADADGIGDDCDRCPETEADADVGPSGCD